MDPNETLKRIDDFLHAADSGPEIDEWCQALKEWLDKDGFEPDWAKFEWGTSYYECYVIQKEKQG